MLADPTGTVTRPWTIDWHRHWPAVVATLWVAAVTAMTARSNASPVASDGFWTPLTLRTYWRAAASISSSVATGWSPRRVVMFRHMDATVAASRSGQGAVTSRR